MTLDSDSDSDHHRQCCASVELGIPDRTKSQYDRLDPLVSRLGGRPAWLALAPSVEATRCSVCSVQMYFLLQFDCPVDGPEGELDRVLYVFACNTKSCVLQSPNDAFRVFAQSRPRDRKSTDAPKVSANFWESDSPSIVQASPPATAAARSSKLVGLTEDTDEFGFPVIILKIVDELIRPRAKRPPGQLPVLSVEHMGGDEDEDDEEGEEDDEAPSVKEDEFTSAFMERVSHYPRQCVRYSPDSDSQPLHFTQAAFDSLHDLYCAKCKGLMQFWGQLMPAILSLLKVDEHIAHIPEAKRGRHRPFGDGLEFATVLVYTCKCGAAVARVELEVD